LARLPGARPVPSASRRRSIDRHPRGAFECCGITDRTVEIRHDRHADAVHTAVAFKQRHVHRGTQCDGWGRGCTGGGGRDRRGRLRDSRGRRGHTTGVGCRAPRNDQCGTNYRRRAPSVATEILSSTFRGNNQVHLRHPTDEAAPSGAAAPCMPIGKASANPEPPPGQAGGCPATSPGCPGLESLTFAHAASDPANTNTATAVPT